MKLLGKSIKISIRFLILILVLNYGFSSCTKLVEVAAPLNSINSQNVYATDATAAAVLTGLYADISAKSNYTNNGLTTISLSAGLSADEFTLFNGANVRQSAYYKNTLSPSTYGFDYWNILYPYVFTCNSVIEGINGSTSLTPSVKNQLLGEAKFMRAFCYYYLVNLYGDVPLVTSTDYNQNAIVAKSSKTIIIQQMVTDLNDAVVSLNDNYVKSDAYSIYPASSAERVRPNKSVAMALLARVYLFSGDWMNAEIQATNVINNSAMFGISSIANAFLKGSNGNNEAIWQLQPVNAGWNTEDAKLFIIPTTGPSATFPVQLSNFLLNSFEIGDQRKSNGNWITSVTVGANTYFYPSKYKSATNGAPVTEYLMVLRLAEQYLIRSEARSQLNNISGAQSDLNVIRKRAGLSNTTAIDKASLLAAILHERQVELFSEWGHRWLDLKRSGSIDAVMGIASVGKGSTWNPNWALYPIPQIDVQRNTNLLQNAGY